MCIRDSAAYVLSAIRVAWWKLYYPREYYAVYFTTRCDAYDIETLIQGKEAVLARYQEILSCLLYTSIVGFAGLLPTMEAIKAHKDIALANKETLVVAGHLIIPLVKEYGVALLPVDSEHSAIFQSMNGEHHGDISKIILTASGGSFRDKSREELKNVTVEQALKHPNWSMGAKITIDSATSVSYTHLDVYKRQ